MQNGLVALIRQGRQTERDVIGTLAPDVQATTGDIQHWSPKDAIVHINVWKEVFADNLKATREGTSVNLHKDFLAYNDEMFVRFQHASWDEVTTYADSVTERLVVEIEHHTDAQLREFQLYPWMGAEETIAGEVLSNCLAHAYQHLSVILSEGAESELALALQEAVVPAYDAFDPSPQSRAAARYNLACTYALLGRGDLAIPLLPHAFELRPDLMNWAQEDSDLASIRDSEEFQALYR